MFADELALHVKAGHGGPGLIHFARRKFQPFGGPDGGDGGNGGDVVLAGNRGVDSLDALRYANLAAEDGKPGQSNLKAGANAPHLEVQVPLGTLAYDIAGNTEIGAVKSSRDRLVVAPGGKGGRGNPHFSSAQNRVPKRAQNGIPGEERDIELRYRIYAETVLIEPATPEDKLILPLLLERDPLEVDYDLYRRKPRWIRTQHNFRLYDVGFLALDYSVSGEAIVIHGPHAYWAKHIVINLCAVEDAEAVWTSLQPWLNSVQLRQAESISCLSKDIAFHPWKLEGEGGGAAVESVQVTAANELLGVFQARLTGGAVE